MGTTSGSDSDRGVREKEVHIVQQSSLDKSDEESKALYNEKSVLAGTVQGPVSSDDVSSDSVKDVFDAEAIDPVLSKKMALVNKAIDEIGMTSFQWKMFFLNGFGYTVDSVR
jgi:hypothetical protein